MTILWNEVTIWWNEVTKGWNEVAWNEVVMERSDWISRDSLVPLMHYDPSDLESLILL